MNPRRTLSSNGTGQVAGSTGAQEAQADLSASAELESAGQPMLKELEQKLRDNHAAWTEDRLWDAFAVTGPDKPSRAQAFRESFDTRDKILPLSPQQTCPVTGKVSTEFEFVCSTIFG